MNQVGERGLDSLGNDYVKTCSNVNDHHMIVQRTKRADEQLSYHDIGLFKEWVNKPFHIQITEMFDTTKDYQHYCIAVSSLTVGTKIQTLPKYGSLEFNTWTVTEEGRIVLWCHRDKCIESTIAISPADNVQLGTTGTLNSSINQTFRFNNKFEIAFQRDSHAEWCIDLAYNTAGVTTLCSRPNKHTSDRLIDQRTWTLILEPGFIHPYCNTLNPTYCNVTYTVIDQENNSHSYTYSTNGYIRNGSTYVVANMNNKTVTYNATSLQTDDKQYARWGMSINGEMFLLEYPEYCIGMNGKLVKRGDSQAKIYKIYNKTYPEYVRDPLSVDDYCIYKDPITTPDDIKEEAIAMQRPLEYAYNTNDNVCLTLLRKSDNTYVEFDKSKLGEEAYVEFSSFNTVSTPTALCRLELVNNVLRPYGEPNYLIGCDEMCVLKMYDVTKAYDAMSFIYKGFNMLTSFLDFKNEYELKLIDKNTFEPSLYSLKIPKCVQGDEIYDTLVTEQIDKNLFKYVALRKNAVTLKHGTTTVYSSLCPLMIDDSNFVYLFTSTGFYKYDHVNDTIVLVETTLFDANDDSFKWILYSNGQLRNKYDMTLYMHYDGTWSTSHMRDPTGFSIDGVSYILSATVNRSIIPTPRKVSNASAKNEFKRGIYDSNANKSYKIATVLDGAIQYTNDATVLDGTNAIKDYVKTNSLPLSIKFETKHVTIPVTLIADAHFTHLTYYRSLWSGQHHNGYLRNLTIDHYTVGGSSSHDTSVIYGSGCCYISTDASVIAIYFIIGLTCCIYTATNNFVDDVITNWNNTANITYDASNISGNALDVACNRDYALMIEVNGNTIRKILNNGTVPHSTTIDNVCYAKICHIFKNLSSANSGYFVIIGVDTVHSKVIAHVIDSDVDTNAGAMYEICSVPDVNYTNDIQKYLCIASTHSAMNMLINGEMSKGNNYRPTLCATAFNSIYYSLDYGKTWTLSFTAPDDILLTGIEYGDGVFLVGTNSTTLYYSFDCITWLEFSYETSETIDRTRVVYGNGEFILCIKNTSNTWNNYYILRSAFDKACTPAVPMYNNRKYFDLLKYHHSYPTAVNMNRTDLKHTTAYSSYYDYHYFITNDNYILRTRDFQTFLNTTVSISVKKIYVYDKYVILIQDNSSFIYITSDSTCNNSTLKQIDTNYDNSSAYAIASDVCVMNDIIYVLRCDSTGYSGCIIYCSFRDLLNDAATWKEYHTISSPYVSRIDAFENELIYCIGTDITFSKSNVTSRESYNIANGVTCVTHDDDGFVIMSVTQIELLRYDSMLRQNVKRVVIDKNIQSVNMIVNTVVYGDGVYLLASNDNNIYFTHDLFNWNTLNNVITDDITIVNGIFFNKDRFIVFYNNDKIKCIPSTSLQLSKHYIDVCYDTNGNCYTISTNAIFRNDELMEDFCYNLRHIKYDHGVVLAYGSTNIIYAYDTSGTNDTIKTYTVTLSGTSTNMTKTIYAVHQVKVRKDVAEVVNIVQQQNQNGDDEVVLTCNTHNGTSFIAHMTADMLAFINSNIDSSNEIWLTYNTCSNYVYSPNVRNCYALMDDTLQTPACRVNGRFYNESKWDVIPIMNTIQSNSLYDVVEDYAKEDTALTYGSNSTRIFIGDDCWAWSYSAILDTFNFRQGMYNDYACWTKVAINLRGDTKKNQYYLMIGGNHIFVGICSDKNDENAETPFITLDPKITLLDACYNNKMFYVCGTCKTLLIGSNAACLKSFSFKELDQCAEDTAILAVKIVDETHVCIICSNGYVTKFNPNFEFICNSHDNTETKNIESNINRKVIVAMNNESLWVSHDGGRSWKRTFQVSTSITFRSIHYYPSYYGDTYFAVTNSNLILYSYDEGYTWHQLPAIPNAVYINGIVSEYIDDNRITVCYSDNTEDADPSIGHCVWIKPWESNEWHEYDYYNNLLICKPSPAWKGRVQQPYSCLFYSKHDGSIALCCAGATASSYPSDSKMYRVWLKGKGKNVFKPILNYNDHTTNIACPYIINSGPHWEFAGYDNIWYTDVINYDADSYTSYVHNDKINSTNFESMITKIIFNEAYSCQWVITEGRYLFRYAVGKSSLNKIWNDFPATLYDIIEYNHNVIAVGANRAIYVFTGMGYSADQPYLHNFRTYTSAHIAALYESDHLKQITHNGYDFLLLTDYGETINEDILSCAQIGSNAPAQVADSGTSTIMMLLKDHKTFISQPSSDAVIDMLSSLVTTRYITKFITRFSSVLSNHVAMICNDGYSIVKNTFTTIDSGTEVTPYNSSNVVPIDATFYRNNTSSYMIISTNSTSPISANNALTTVTSFYRVDGDKWLDDLQDAVHTNYRINAKWVSNLSLSATNYICVVTYARNSNAYDSTNTPIAAYNHTTTKHVMINASGDISATGKAVFANIEGNTYDKNIFLIPFSGGFVWHNETDNVTEFVKPNELIGVTLTNGIFTKHSGNTFLFTTNSNYIAYIKLTNMYNNGSEYKVTLIDMRDKVVTIMQQNGEEYILTQHHIYHINSVGSDHINVTELIPYNINCRPNDKTFSQFVATQNHNIVLDNNGTWCECYVLTENTTFNYLF